jgi:hypothetical protein
MPAGKGGRIASQEEDGKLNAIALTVFFIYTTPAV